MDETVKQRRRGQARLAFTICASLLAAGCSSVPGEWQLNDWARARMDEARELAAAGDEAGALEVYRVVAAEGFPQAKYEVGRAYNRGLGVARDPAAAAVWFEDAAAYDSSRQGNAAYELGRLARDGEGVPRSDGAAVGWFTLAAEKGVVAAQAELGRMAMEGRPPPVDPAAAIAHFEAAAEGGDHGAMLALADIWREGKGVPASPERAARFGEAARAQLETEAGGGSVPAMAALGRLYLDGTYIRVDEARGRGWLERAATAGNVPAMTTLGRLLTDGEGIEDPQVGAGWLQLAADSGDTGAMTSLGRAYLRGIGVDQDRARGLAWLTRAAGLGNESAQRMLSREAS